MTDSVHETVEGCPLCDTPMVYAPGIGDYCPNKDCAVVDGPDLYDPTTKRQIRPDPVCDRPSSGSPRETAERIVRDYRSILRVSTPAGLTSAIAGALSERDKEIERRVAEMRERCARDCEARGRAAGFANVFGRHAEAYFADAAAIRALPLSPSPPTEESGR